MNEFSRTFHFDFDHPVDKLWSVIADTPRWGEALGLPKYESTEELTDDGTIRVLAQVAIAGLMLRWEELPANAARHGSSAEASAECRGQVSAVLPNR